MILTKRTNILFDDALWQHLVSESIRESVSVGELVRRAVRRVYHADDAKKQVEDAIRTIRKTRKTQRRIDYAVLVAKGRSY